MKSFQCSEIAEALGAEIGKHSSWFGFWGMNQDYFFCPIGELFIVKAEDIQTPIESAVAVVKYGSREEDIDWHTLYKYYGGAEQLIL